MALIKCPECSKEVSDKATDCIHCGYPLKKGLTPQEELEFLRLCDEIDSIVNDDDDDEEWELMMDKEKILCCPNCYSSDLTPMKKGFGFGKAVLGVLTVGMYGIVAGSIGQNKIRFFCNGCGNSFSSKNALSLTRYEQKIYKDTLRL